ncbi:hypothetical protein CMK22_07645 [Candidatus Poribacteria bacterium]|nr:hypothetical protein [Candidatus Poribacteria bacterium]
MILHSNRKVFSLSLVGFAFLLCFSAFVNARVKHVYKLMLMDYRGNTKIEYTTSDPSTYIAYNGGSALIKGFRVLEHWSVHVDSSLYGQSLVDLEPAKYRQALVRSNLNVISPLSPSAAAAVNAQILPANSSSSQTVASATLDVNSNLLNNSFVATPLFSRQDRARFAKIGKFDKVVRVSQLVTPRIQDVVVTAFDDRIADISPAADSNLSQPKVNESGGSISAEASLARSKDLPKLKVPLVKKLDSTILRRLRRYDRLITHAATRNGLDPNLLKALVYIESAGNYKAVSPKRAMGLTQLRIPTAREMGVKNIFNPQQNLLGGAKYLSQQLKTFKNESTALAAYNAGPTRVRRGNTLPFETRSYVNKVLAVRNILASK